MTNIYINVTEIHTIQLFNISKSVECLDTLVSIFNIKHFFKSFQTYILMKKEVFKFQYLKWKRKFSNWGQLAMLFDECLFSMHFELNVTMVMVKANQNKMNILTVSAKFCNILCCNFRSIFLRMFLCLLNLA